ncbi:hypothetical protein FRB99_000435 [Tulasnella sp. 403]|nr:hypothetical protein FRB99_000435 [Tulasnella sp. 403]
MPTKKASTSSEPALRRHLSQTFEAPSAESVIVSAGNILYPTILDPGWKFELSFRDSYLTCHEKLIPYFEFMREYIILNQLWIPSRHIMAFNTLHSEWSTSMDVPPEKGFWKQELISQKGHTLASKYWSRLKELRRQMSRRATTKAVKSIMAEKEIIEDLIRTNRKAALDSIPSGRSSALPKGTPEEAGPSAQKSPPPFDADDIDPNRGFEGLDIDIQLPASNAPDP